jgi:putative SOS response-associated peptidase YedK
LVSLVASQGLIRSHEMQHLLLQLSIHLVRNRYNGKTAHASQLPVGLLRPYPAEQMKAWKVGSDVGNVRNNRRSW